MWLGFSRYTDLDCTGWWPYIDFNQLQTFLFVNDSVKSNFFGTPTLIIHYQTYTEVAERKANFFEFTLRTIMFVDLHSFTSTYHTTLLMNSNYAHRIVDGTCRCQAQTFRSDLV